MASFAGASFVPVTVARRDVAEADDVRRAKRQPSLPNINLMRLFCSRPRPPLRSRTNSDVAAPPSSPSRSRVRRTASKTKAHCKRMAPPTPKGGNDDEDIAVRYGPVFARQVLLLQLMDGGSIEHNVQRMLRKYAKAEARAAGVQYVPGTLPSFARTEEAQPLLADE